MVDDWETIGVVICCCCDILKISAGLCNTRKLGLETSKRWTGDGFCRAVMRSNAVLTAMSAEDVRIIGLLCGKKATVSESRGGFVAGM